MDVRTLGRWLLATTAVLLLLVPVTLAKPEPTDTEVGVKPDASDRSDAVTPDRSRPRLEVEFDLPERPALSADPDRPDREHRLDLDRPNQEARGEPQKPAGRLIDVPVRPTEKAVGGSALKLRDYTGHVRPEAPSLPEPPPEPPALPETPEAPSRPGNSMSSR